MSSHTLQNPITKSIGIHLLFLAMVLFGVAHAPKLTQPLEPITIDIVEEAKKKTESHVDSIKRTIVQKSDGTESDVAKKDSYLSDKTRVVDEEHSAKTAGEVDGGGRVSNHEAIRKPKPQAATLPQQKDIKLSDLGVQLKMQPKPANPAYDSQRQWANSQTGEAMRGGQYVQGMKEGEVSALNTKEFVFYAYFDRVRKQLDQAWQPLLREQIQKIYRNGRHLASDADYVTRTTVTLNEKGEILRVQVLEESGTFDIDQVAIDALNKAGPYPNPPKGLVDQSGTVQIRWDFVLRT